MDALHGHNLGLLTFLVGQYGDCRGRLARGPCRNSLPTRNVPHSHGLRTLHPVWWNVCCDWNRFYPKPDHFAGYSSNWIFGMGPSPVGEGSCTYRHASTLIAFVGYACGFACGIQ